MTRQDFLYEVKDYVNITLGLLLYTFSFTLFLLPYQIVTGGISGIGAIVFYSTGFPVQYTFFIINAVLIVLALKILGWKFLTKTIYATFMLTLFLEIFQDIITMPNGEFYKILGENNDFMSLLIGCMMTGTALAIVFLNNGSTGGTDIVAAVLNKFHNITLGKALIMIDICIISSCLFIDSFGSGTTCDRPYCCGKLYRNHDHCDHCHTVRAFGGGLSFGCLPDLCNDQLCGSGGTDKNLYRRISSGTRGRKGGTIGWKCFVLFLRLFF